MSFYVCSRPNFLALAYARVGLPAPGFEEPVEFMKLERRWSEPMKKRIERCDWAASHDAAWAFGSEDEAWTAFDRTGYGRREDYEVKEISACG